MQCQLQLFEYPPHHINLLSKEGYKALFNNSGLENVKIITPGKLDIDIVRNFTRENNLKINGIIVTDPSRNVKVDDEIFFEIFA